MFVGMLILTLSVYVENLNPRNFEGVNHPCQNATFSCLPALGAYSIFESVVEERLVPCYKFDLETHTTANAMHRRRNPSDPFI